MSGTYDDQTYYMYYHTRQMLASVDTQHSQHLNDLVRMVMPL